MYKIYLGTQSEQKLQIVKSYFTNIIREEISIKTKDVKSEIMDQPLTEEITIDGAKNRSRNAIKDEKNYDFSIGLEGGLSLINSIYYLVCVVSIFENNKFYVGVSKKIPLPILVSNKIKNGKEFGIVIREYKNNLENTLENKKLIELTDELISREKSFTEALDMAFTIYKLKREY